MKGIVILVSLVIIVQMGYMAAAQPSGVWVLTNTTTDNGYTDKCSDDTTTCIPPSISAGTVVIPYTINDHHGFFQKYSYTAKWTVPPSVLTPETKWMCTLGLSVEYEHSGGPASYHGGIGIMDSIGGGSWQYLQNYAQAHIDMGTGDPTPAPASTTVEWDVPSGNIGDVLTLCVIASSGYNVKTYYTYTYQATGTQPAPAVNVPPHQTEVDHVSIIPGFDAPSSLINNDFVYTTPSNRNMSPLPIHFRVLVNGPQDSQVPDGTPVHFELIDMGLNGGDTAGAKIAPLDGHTTNSELTLTFTPPTDAYWQSHDPLAVDATLNTMRIRATCGGKDWSFNIEMKPYPEPPSTGSSGSIKSTTGSTTF